MLAMATDHKGDSMNPNRPPRVSTGYARPSDVLPRIAHGREDERSERIRRTDKVRAKDWR